MTKPLRVLLVEESADEVMLLVRHLSQYGYSPSYLQVATAAAMRQALREQEWDVVLSDHRTPGLSAHAALTILQEMERDLPFIIVAGAIGEESAVAAMRAGAHDYVRKDRLSRLVPAIEREVRAAAGRLERRRTWAAQRFLAQVGELLAASTDYEAALAGIARLAVPAIADRCTVCLVTEAGDFRPLAVVDVDPVRAETAREMLRALGAGPGATGATLEATGAHRPVLHATVSDGMLAAMARDEAQLRALRSLGYLSLIIVPLTSRGRKLGVLALATGESGRRYGPPDLAIAEALGTRVALALDNFMLLQELQQAVRRQDEALALLDALFASSPVGMTFRDPQLRYLRVNEAQARIDGKPVAAHLGRTVREMYPEVAPVLEPLLQQVLATGEPVLNAEVAAEMPAHSGEQRHWLVSFYPVYTPDGQLLGIGSGSIEVTERKQAEMALQQSNARFQALVRASPLPIEALDTAGRVTAWSPAAERVFGWSEAEVLGRVPPNIPPERLAEDRALLQQAMPGECLIGLVVQRLRHDGKRAEFSLSAAPLCDAAGKIVGQVRVLVDVTERNRFLEVAAHELRNPMATVRSLSYLIHRRVAGGRPSNEVAPLTGMLEQEVSRLASLLTEILEAVRMQEGQLPLVLEPTDLAALVERALAPYRATTGRHRFRAEGLDHGPVWVRGDLHRLEQVMDNLLGNAAKYSPHGGEISTRLEVRDNRAVVSVNDQGLGIPANQLPQVFDAFFRARRRRRYDPGGLGLGLFISQGIIRQHAGRIWAESKEGQGTTFYFELPLCPPEEAGGDGAPALD